VEFTILLFLFLDSWPSLFKTHQATKAASKVNKNLKNRAFKIETCEGRKMRDSKRGRSGVGYEKGFGGHRERKGLEEEGGVGCES
jgi:hypothetical protein